MARKYQICHTDNSDYRPTQHCEWHFIKEWNIGEQIILENWRKGTPIPQSRFMSVQFPEIHLLDKYTQYRSFRYSIEMSYDSLDFFELTGISDFNNVNISSVFSLRYKNFNQITTSVKGYITYKVFAKKNGVEEFLEEKKQTVFIDLGVEVITPVGKIEFDKKVYYLKYNRASLRLTGDYKLLLNNITAWELNKAYDLWFDIVDGLDLFTFTRTVASNTIYYIRPKKPFKNNAELPEIGEVITTHRFFFTIDNTPEFVIPFKTHLSIYNDPEEFKIKNKKNYNFSLVKKQNKRATGFFDIENPIGLSFTIDKPDYISIFVDYKFSIENPDVTRVSFYSLPAKELPEPINKGQITVKFGSRIEVIDIIINVIEVFSFNQQPINFCLDNNPIIATKSDEKVKFLTAQINMKFEDISHTQNYEFVYFKNKTELPIGNEINDFFNDSISLNKDIINTLNPIIPVKTLSPCFCYIELQEKDEKGVIYDKIKYEDVVFLPGKKPKAYPYLTEATLRSVTDNSIISLSALKSELLDKSLHQIAGQVNLSVINASSTDVISMIFKRNLIMPVKESREVVSNSFITFEPIPNKTTFINALFVNQNLCLDWFTFSEFYTETGTVENTFSNDLFTSEKEKIEVKTNNFMKLDAGWVLKEEKNVLNDLITSKRVFLFINNKWVKAVAVSKKLTPLKEADNFINFIVEFEIIE